jgi:type II secretory pathway component PulJ
MKLTPRERKLRKQIRSLQRHADWAISRISELKRQIYALEKRLDRVGFVQYR